MFKIIRVLFLMLILAAVAFYTKSQKLNSQAWIEPLDIVIYPLNAEKSVEVEEYIESLEVDDFTEIDTFFQREGEEHQLIVAQPTHTRLGQEISSFPPEAPRPDEGMFAIMWWGLKFRYWAFKHTPDDESNHHRIRVFVYYHSLSANKVLKHSLGLDKGLLAIVHAFADEKYAAQNNIIIAHEFLHTVGASDKYGHNNQPLFPEGYADIQQEPLYPQQQAEIMAARIPLSATQARMATDLSQCIVGMKTAQEIKWQAL